MKTTSEFRMNRAGDVALLVLAVAGCMPGGSDRMVLRKAPIVRAELVRTVDATGKVTPRNTSSDSSSSRRWCWLPQEASSGFPWARD